MSDSPESPLEPKPRGTEYEDPHYHDEDDVDPGEEGTDRKPPPSNKTKKPARKLPPPRRRFPED